MSPADAEYHRIGRLPLFVRELQGYDVVSLFDRPVDIGIVCLEPLLEGMPDILFAADAEVDSLSIQLIQAWGQGKLLDRLVDAFRVETLVGLLFCCWYFYHSMFILCLVYTHRSSVYNCKRLLQAFFVSTRTCVVVANGGGLTVAVPANRCSQICPRTSVNGIVRPVCPVIYSVVVFQEPEEIPQSPGPPR